MVYSAPDHVTSLKKEMLMWAYTELVHLKLTMGHFINQQFGVVISRHLIKPTIKSLEKNMKIVTLAKQNTCKTIMM